ncbi:hypothetical protein H8356DRAFT_1718568 [Neocallimastix lanati (nom. inval.)]|jgi:hypothetical protein|nr:hypothetical protein H8356DRAFT_1718568 [Neocallimastix sp. JGI-2020a]
MTKTTNKKSNIMAKSTNKKRNNSLLYGLLGSTLFAIGDFVMTYGTGDNALISDQYLLSFLTVGIAKIPSWSNLFSLFIVLPGGTLLLTGLFALQKTILTQKHKKIYYYIIIFSSLHWLVMHTFYNIIFYTSQVCYQEGYENPAHVTERLFSHYYGFITYIGITILLPLIYLFWIIASGRTTLSRWICLCDPLITFKLIGTLASYLPDKTLKSAITAASMNTACVLAFIVLYLFSYIPKSSKSKTN